MRIWDLTHLEEHCGEQGSSTREISANIVLGAHLGPFQINMQYCWPTPQARSQYVVHFRDDVAVNGYFAHNNLCSGTAFRPDCYLYTIRNASPRRERP